VRGVFEHGGGGIEGGGSGGDVMQGLGGEFGYVWAQVLGRVGEKCMGGVWSCGEIKVERFEGLWDVVGVWLQHGAEYADTTKVSMGWCK